MRGTKLHTLTATFFEPSRAYPRFPKPVFPILAFLALTMLSISVAGCVKTVFLEPPPGLLVDCPYPQLARDPAIDLLGYEQSLERCNADKLALRIWRDELRGR